MERWRHVFKLDPARPIQDEQIKALVHSETDAIMIGGSSEVTYDNTFELVQRIKHVEIPVVLEISNAQAIVHGMDAYMVPVVLNTDNPRWILQEQLQAIQKYGEWIPWERVYSEGYIILNPHSTAAKRTGAKELDQEEILAFHQMAEHLFHFPIFYIEYSGVLGDIELVKMIKAKCQHTRLFYGGGISSASEAENAAMAAHTIVVGNVIYEDFEQALQTVKGVKRADKRLNDIM